MDLEQLKLPAMGLVVFGARPGMGLTRTTLLLANHLAKEQRVSFVSYHSYTEKIQNVLLDVPAELATALQINTSLPYYDSEFKDHLASLITDGGTFTVFLDDLHSMLGDTELERYERNKLIEELSKRAYDSGALIILNIYVSDQVDVRTGDRRPLLRDFNWSRNLLELADQIYTIYRPEYYCIIQDENGFSTRNRIEVNLIKNKSANIK